MKLKYLGHRNYVRSDFDHKRYAFSKENNFICDVEDRAAIRLIRTGQYIPIVEVIEVTKKEIKKGFVCEVCGKVCKNKIGLVGHSRTHNK